MGGKDKAARRGLRHKLLNGDINMSRNRTEDDMVCIAKRENNTKRKYLVVNRLQGKHIPVSGSRAFIIFDELAKKVLSAYSGERLLLVGFAETATAIGARLSVTLDSLYIQTTREQIEDVDYLYFTESHSHATEQKLVKNDIDSVIDKTDRIVFVEDEVTTGNTIMKIIEIIEKTYSQKVKFSVASLLNGMNEENLAKYKDKGIDTLFLVKTNHDAYTAIADGYKGDGEYIERDFSPANFSELIADNSYVNTRRITEGAKYGSACEHLFGRIYDPASFENAKDILVIGTEEFMFPALYTACKLECLGFNALSHSTTRSPIAVSSEQDYPLHRRFELISFYDDNRTTYIYDLKKYDKVIIITDSTNESPKGRYTLVNALKSVGNDDITIYRWSDTASNLSSDNIDFDSLVGTSYSHDDVILLLKDVTGLVKPQPTEERERLIQAGKHYCEMLPIEYVPTPKYMQVYEEALKTYAKPTALAVGKLSDKIIAQKGKDVVLVSLARAGIPIGILLKRYIAKEYGVSVPHYSISIIRGRGIDRNALDFLIGKYGAENLLFVDGWIGKGAILGELQKELSQYPGVSSDIAVLADPANVTELCGTHDDILIPSSCLNSTVSGLVSRTFLRDDIIGERDFHGAVYYGELADSDLSYEFINAIEKEFEQESEIPDRTVSGLGIDEVREIAEHFGIDDINLVKPGIGETTRVLLRRVPWKVLIDEKYKNSSDIAHIVRLAEEKNVPIEYYPLTHYKTCGIIKKLADA